MPAELVNLDNLNNLDNLDNLPVSTGQATGSVQSTMPVGRLYKSIVQ